MFGGFQKQAALMVAVMTCLSTMQAHAVDSSGAGDAAYLSTEEAASFSKSIERDLASKGARVAIVFRSGRTRDRLPDNIKYTHGAFWIHQDIQRSDGTVMKGYAVYNLYHGDDEKLPKTKSYLEQDFPFDFTKGSVVDDVAVIIPHKALQTEILKLIAAESYEDLHIEDYSLVSNVANARYQNCNEFLLDVMASAIWQTSNYQQIKANLDAYFEPTEIEAGLFKRILAPMADKRIRTGDHDGPIKTATYASLSDFLGKYALLQETYLIDRRKLYADNSANQL